MKSLVQSIRADRWRVLAPALMLFVVLAPFWRTLFLGEPVYRLHLLPQIDVLFKSKLMNLTNLVDDPSAFLLQMPNGLFIERCARDMVVPLWNRFTGLGQPFIGNIQTYQFSPLRFIFPVSNSHAYNVGIIFGVAAAALGVYLLTRKLGLSRWSSVLAGTSYALCPHVLHNIELPPRLYMYPWIFFMFVWLARGPLTIGRAVIVGVISGLIPYSMHPETFFVSMLFGSLLGAYFASQKADRRQAIFDYLKCFLIAAIIGISIAAPVLIPFAEFFRNTVCYKYSYNFPSFFPWNEYIRGLVAPVKCTLNPYLSAPYLGYVVAMLLPLGILQCWRKHRYLLALLIPLGILSTWIPPFHLILSKQPFCWVLPNYFLPPFVLTCAIIGACGFERLVENSPFDRKSLFLLGFSILAGSGASIFYAVNWINGLPVELHSISYFWEILNKSSALFLGLLALAICVRIKASPPVFILVALIFLNFVSLSSSIQDELPVVKRFDNFENDAVRFLRQNEGRFTATSPNLFLPNVSLGLGLPDMRSFQTLHAERYLRFMSKLGARHHLSLFFQVPTTLGQLVDLASVKYILAISPVRSDTDSPENPHFVQVFNGQNGIRIYENKRVLPEAYAVPQVISASGGEQALDTIASSNFDGQASVVIEESEGIVKNLTDTRALNDATASSDRAVAANLKWRSPNEAEIDIVSPWKGVLVFTQTNFPGWEASIDGKSAEILKANYLFQGVAIEKGVHKIRFRYHPKSYSIGCVLFITTSSIILLLLLTNYIRRRRSQL